VSLVPPGQDRAGRPAAGTRPAVTARGSGLARTRRRGPRPDYAPGGLDERAGCPGDEGAGSQLQGAAPPGRAGVRQMSRQERLTAVLLLNLLLVTALVIAGLSARSLGVLAAGGDYLADAAAIGVSLLALWLSCRPPSARRPGGYPGATNVAALLNGGWLLVLNVVIAVAAIRRLVSGAPRVEGLPVLIVSAVAALVMLAGALILAGDNDGGQDLNMKAVLLDTAADAAAAGGVAVSGAVILSAGGLYWMDPAVALIIAVVVGYHALRLTWKVAAAIRSSAHPGQVADRKA